VNATLARFAIVASGLLLAGRIVQVNAVYYDDAGQPRLPAVADAPGAPRPDAQVLREILAENPAHAAALLMLAREHEKASRWDDARRAYRAAVAIAPLDREGLGAAAGFFLARGEIAEGLALLDRLVANYPDTRDRVFPALAGILANPAHAAAWNAVVARNPAWLGSFISYTCQRSPDVSPLLPLFLGRAAAGRATTPEASCLVERLRAAGRFEDAYQLWLNTLPRERLSDVGYVFNGNFEYHPSGIAYDWMIDERPEREVGHVADLGPAAGAVAKRALRVTYNGKRQQGNAATQALMLAPGRYELAGFGRAHALTVGRGVQWTVRCIEAGRPRAPIGASERFTGSSEWRRFTFEIEVAPGCAGQVLQLEPVGADEGPAFVGGAVWFDDLVLRRR
jgi:hypothetical protein